MYGEKSAKGKGGPRSGEAEVQQGGWCDTRMQVRMISKATGNKWSWSGSGTRGEVPAVIDLEWGAQVYAAAVRLTKRGLNSCICVKYRLTWRAGRIDHWTGRVRSLLPSGRAETGAKDALRRRLLLDTDQSPANHRRRHSAVPEFEAGPPPRRQLARSARAQFGKHYPRRPFVFEHNRYVLGGH